MQLSEQIKNNTVLALISGSFLLQLFILMVALIYRYNSNGAINLASSNNLASSKTSALAVPNETLTKKQSTSKDTTTSVTSDRKLTETEVSYTITSGDTLSKIWAKQSSFPNGGIKAAEAFKDENISVSNLKVGDEITLKLSPEHDIIEFSMKLPEGKSLKLTGNSTDGYKAKVSTTNIIVKERTVSYPIFDTFSESAQDVSIPVEIIDDLVDLLSARLDFRALHPGDAFTAIYEERTTEDGEVLAPGKIKAFSIETNNKVYVAIQHEGSDGKIRYFNEDGELLGDSFLRYPLKFSRISSVFTTSRFHPILKINRPHNGVDFSAPTGTPVRSIGDGVVEYASFGAETGNMVKIKHNDKYSTAYMHLSKISSFVKKGSHVSKGDVIGAVGSTGLATAPHLHFAMYDKDKFINPMTANLPVISSKENSIPKTILASTMNIIKQQHQLVRMASLIKLNKAA